MKYSVHLIDEHGKGSYLSVKGRTSWKTKRIARQHADDIQTLIDKGKNIFNAVAVDLENEFGELIIDRRCNHGKG